MVQIDRRFLTRRTLLAGGLAAATTALAGCAPEAAESSAPAVTPTPTPTPTPATPLEIAARATVPVLCYHQVRPYAAGDSSYNR